MKKIAVTGANGFIGSRLYRHLTEAGNEVIALVRKGSDISLLPAQANIERIDLSDSNSLSSVLKNCDIVIHLAALTKARTWRQFKNVNIGLVNELIKIVNDSSKIEQFIFLSSQAAAGPALSAIGKTEDEKCTPVSQYGKSKLLAERLIIKKCDCPWTIIRPVSVFGPGDKDFYEYYKIINKGIAPLIGLSNHYMNLIHVDDLCHLITSSVSNSQAFRQIFFASSTEAISQAGFAYIIAEALHKKIFNLRIAIPLLYAGVLFSAIWSMITRKASVFNYQKLKEMKQRYWLASNKKAIKRLGFVPATTLTRQMIETIKWYKDQELL